jgi:hypothetical protein
MKSLLLIFCLALFSCNNDKDQSLEIKEGTISLKSRVIYDASKGYEKNVVLNISRMYFYDSKIMEFVPNSLDDSVTDSINIIVDTMYHNVKAKSEKEVNEYDYANLKLNRSVFDKNFGSIFRVHRDSIYGYNRRIDLSDTIIDGTEFKRFMIRDKLQISHFWLEKTDSILPYQLNTIANKDYNARLKRIDTYRANKDIFQTVILDYEPTIPKGIKDRLKLIE